MIPRWDLVPFVNGAGIDPVGPKPSPFRHMARVTPDQLGMIASGSLDFVVLREPVTVEVLRDLWARLKVGGRLVVWIPKAQAFNVPQWLGAVGWDWVHHSEDADSALQVWRRRGDLTQREAIERPAHLTAAVVRPGGFGDALMASSILPHLVAEGYDVTAYVEKWGEEALRHDPHISRFVVGSLYMIGKDDLGAYWEHERAKYDRWINLSDTVERALLFRNEALESRWPHAVRKDIARVSYLERVHAVAEVEPEYQQRYYPMPAEMAEAKELRGDADAVVAVIDSGSHAQKWWPYAGDFALELVARWPRVKVVFLGEMRSRVPAHERIEVFGRSGTFRQAAAVALRADVVVGQDSGLMQAVAFEESVAKVVLHAITSPLNLTTHWPRTVSLMPEDTDCYPCHISHRNWDLCRRHAATGAAACQADIARETVLDAVEKALDFVGPTAFNESAA